jgi:hypothetical protein
LAAARVVLGSGEALPPVPRRRKQATGKAKKADVRAKPLLNPLENHNDDDDDDNNDHRFQRL